MEQYRFERLSENNLHHLVVLYRHCFNYNTDIHFLKNKYNTVAFGSQYLGYLAFSLTKNEPAAYYGVFPIKGLFNKREVLIAQSGDTMTHPDHQGKGLFTQLARKTYELALQNEIRFIFGFPNKNSYPGFIKKLNWTHYADVNNYVLKASKLPFDKLAKKIPLFNKVYSAWVQRKLKPITVSTIIPNSLQYQSENYGTVIYDSNYYEYKKYHNYFIIQLNGIKSVIKIDGRLWVGEIEFCNEEKFKATVFLLIKLAKKLGCAGVQFSLFNNSSYDIILQKIASTKGKNPIGYITLINDVNPEMFAYQAFDFDTY